RSRLSGPGGWLLAGTGGAWSIGWITMDLESSRGEHDRRPGERRPGAGPGIEHGWLGRWPAGRKPAVAEARDDVQPTAPRAGRRGTVRLSEQLCGQRLRRDARRPAVSRQPDCTLLPGRTHDVRHTGRPRRPGARHRRLHRKDKRPGAAATIATGLFARGMRPRAEACRRIWRSATTAPKHRYSRGAKTPIRSLNSRVGGIHVGIDLNGHATICPSARPGCGRTD